jgi:hypothetical protein
MVNLKVNLVNDAKASQGAPEPCQKKRPEGRIRGRGSGAFRRKLVSTIRSRPVGSKRSRRLAQNRRIAPLREIGALRNAPRNRRSFNCRWLKVRWLFNRPVHRGRPSGATRRMGDGGTPAPLPFSSLTLAFSHVVANNAAPKSG